MYRNQGGGTFEPVGAGLIGITTGTVQWGDMDRDGVLDLFASGYAQESPISDGGISTRIYENLREEANSRPKPPAGIDVTAFNKAAGAVQITWDATTDDATDDATDASASATEQAALGYDLYVQETGSGAYVDPPEALVGGSNDGRRMVVERGQLQGTETVIRGLDEDKQYTIGIQAVDHSFAGSSYATVTVDGSLLEPATAVTKTVDGPGIVSFDEIGLRIRFSDNTTGSGTVTAKAFNAPPLGEDGIAESNVSQYSYVITASSGLSVGSGTDVLFDVATLNNVTDPETVFTYTRPVAGTGSFEVRPTAYNTDTDELSATVDGFSEFVFASDENPLPVELTTLDVQQESEAIVLNWETTSETNNAGFEVQRQQTSGPEPTWERIGFVEGAGTTDAPQSYRFRDTAPPFADSLVYRLKQIDINGTESFSDPVAIQQGLGAEVQLATPFPNPVQQQATVRYIVPEGKSQPVRLQVYNILGQRVATLVDESKTPGREEVALDASRWASGTYFLRLQVGSVTKTRRVTVVR